MKKAFTLAEILATLTIIGIVTALTIPNVFANIQNKNLVGQLQAVDASFKYAVKQAMIDERVTTLTNTVYGTSAGDFLKKYFKVTADCGTSHTNCLASSYKSLNGKNTIATSSMLNNNFYCVKISSGAVICSTKMGKDTVLNHGNSIVVIDVNGKTSPNKNGRDLFSFNIYTDGKIGNSYDSASSDANGTTCSNNSSKAGYSGACYSKIIADGWKMDY